MSAFAAAWLRACRSAAATATAAQRASPCDWNIAAAASARAMIPTFSIVEKASSSFSSGWKSAYVMPSSADTPPSASSVRPIQRAGPPTHSRSSRASP